MSSKLFNWIKNLKRKQRMYESRRNGTPPSPGYENHIAMNVNSHMVGRISVEEIQRAMKAYQLAPGTRRESGMPIMDEGLTELASPVCAASGMLGRTSDLKQNVLSK